MQENYDRLPLKTYFLLKYDRYWYLIKNGMSFLYDFKYCSNMVQNEGNRENTQGYENTDVKNDFPKGLNFELFRS